MLSSFSPGEVNLNRGGDHSDQADQNDEGGGEKGHDKFEGIFEVVRPDHDADAEKKKQAGNQKKGERPPPVDKGKCTHEMDIC